MLKIDKIHVAHYGKWEDYTLSFSDGLNVLVGENGAGKSTLMAFLKAMFYGFGDNRGDIATANRKKYQPWDGSSMGGEVEFTYDGVPYVLTRTAGKTKNSDKCNIVSALTGETAPFTMEELLGVSQQSFEKTLFISQLGTPVDGASDELTAKLMNLSTSGEENVSYEKAIKRLDAAKKDLTKKGVGKIPRAEDTLFALEERLAKQKQVKERMQALEQRLSLLKEKVKEQQTPPLEKILLYQQFSREKEEAEKAEQQYSVARSAKTGQPAKPALSVLLLAALILLLCGCVALSLWKAPLAVSILLPAALAAVYGVNYNKKLQIYNEQLRQEVAAAEELLRLEQAMDAAVGALENTRQEILKAYGTFEENFSFEKEQGPDWMEEVYKASEQLALEKANLADETELAQDIVHQQEKLAGYRRTYEALEQAEQALEEAFAELQADFTPKLNQLAQDIYTRLTGDEHSISIPRQLKPVVDHKDLAYFSGGTCDQIYFSLRMALAALLLSPDAPLFLDDPFLQYDDKRQAAAMKFLEEEGNTRQIFLFTCRHTGEKEYTIEG